MTSQNVMARKIHELRIIVDALNSQLWLKELSPADYKDKILILVYNNWELLQEMSPSQRYTINFLTVG